MERILTATAVIGMVVLAGTQVLKQVISDNKWLPLLNVVLGLGIGLVYAGTIVRGEYAIYGWAGAISGLSAGGFYDLGAAVKALVHQARAQALIADGQGKQDGRPEEGE